LAVGLAGWREVAAMGVAELVAVDLEAVAAMEAVE
jgi:hypothetical protein